MTQHTPACWAMPDCTTCHRRKAPRGRSIPLAASGGYCTYDCPGYDENPKPGHFWPEEEPELRAEVDGHPLAAAMMAAAGPMGVEPEPEPTPGMP